MDYQVNGAPIPFNSDNLLAESLALVAEDYKISPAEHQALLLVLSGRSIDDIAEMLNLKPVTVRKRLGEVYQKFGIYGAGPGKLAKLQHMLLTLSQTHASGNTSSHRPKYAEVNSQFDSQPRQSARRGRAAERSGSSYGTKSATATSPSRAFSAKGSETTAPTFGKKTATGGAPIDLRQLRINIPVLDESSSDGVDAPSVLDANADASSVPAIISSYTKELTSALIGQYDLMVIWGPFGIGKSYQLKQIADVLSYSARSQWGHNLLCWRYVCDGKATVKEVAEAWQAWHQNIDPHAAHDPDLILIPEEANETLAEKGNTENIPPAEGISNAASGEDGSNSDPDYSQNLIAQWCALSAQEPLILCLDDLPNTLEWQHFLQQWVAVTEKMPQSPKLCCTCAAKTTWLASLAASSARLYLWECEGIDLAIAQKCLAKWQLQGDLSHWQTLVYLYRGSPRHLRRTADLINNLFSGKIHEFLLLDEIYVDEATQKQLQEQIRRCEPIQLKILATLAKASNPLTLSQLGQNIGKMPIMERLNHLEALRWQSLIEIYPTSDDHPQTRYGLPPVVREVYQQALTAA
ncbi:MAG: hypothetical protein WCO45_00300 [Pseudanabaena sp. ELA607]|jgi:hypothetical protein